MEGVGGGDLAWLVTQTPEEKKGEGGGAAIISLERL